MKSPESLLHQPQSTGKLQMPLLPGINSGDTNFGSSGSNPFAGIRRAGQAKRAMNFERWQGKDASAPGSATPQKSFDGSKFQMAGGQAKTQFGSMKQAKF